MYMFGENTWQIGGIQSLTQRGCPLRVAHVMRQGNPKEITPSAIDAVSHETIKIERWYYEPTGIDWTQTDLYDVGVQHVRAYVARFPIDRRADYHYSLNEPMPGVGTASFWRGAMDEAKRQDIKLCVGNWPETWPALPGDLDEHGQPKYLRDFWTWPDVHDMVAQIIADKHVLSYHTYIIPDPNGPWDHGYSMGREDQLIATLPGALQGVPIILTEWGTGCSQGFSDDALLAGIHAGDTWLHATKANVLGACAWVAANWVDNAHPKVSSDLAFHKDKLLAYWTGAKF